MSDDTPKIIQTVAEIIVVNPGAWCEFEVSIGCYVGSEHLPSAQTNIYRIKGKEWQRTPPFPFGSAFQVLNTSDPL